MFLKPETVSIQNIHHKENKNVSDAISRMLSMN